MIKTCVSSYSFGDYQKPEHLGTVGVIHKAAEMGFDGIEFIENELTTLEKAGEIKKTCEEAGITPVAFCVGADFVKEEEAQLEQEILRVKQLCDVAERMGVSMLPKGRALRLLPAQQGTVV